MVDVCGVCLQALGVPFLKRGMPRYIHIGVGFCVARSTLEGNAKALNRGTSDRYRFPRFFFIYV